MSSASVKSRVGRLCGCHYRMVSYQCMNGPNKGRLFWRCPNWSSSETCSLFIWDEDLGEKSGNEDGAIRNLELDGLASVGYMKSLYEDERKKKKKLKNKLKNEEFHGKLKMMFLVVSILINVYFF